MKQPNQILRWMTETLESFISQLSLSKSKPTVDAYRYDVSKFLEHLASRNVRSIKTLKPTHIIDYLGTCKQQGKSDASINRYYMAIRSYCRYLRRSKLVAFDLTEDVDAPRIAQKAPRVPTVQEVQSILEQPNTSTHSGLRDRAILELLYSSGLRASELCALQIHHVGPRQVMVSCGKRGKTRTVPLTEEASDWVNQYIKKCRAGEKGILFATLMGKPLRRQLLCKIVVTYSEKAQIEDVTTHTLRHACATHLLDQGADIRLIQEVLGHSSIASTQRYTHLSSNRMEEMFNRFHPRQKTQQAELKQNIQ